MQEFTVQGLNREPAALEQAAKHYAQHVDGSVIFIN